MQMATRVSDQSYESLEAVPAVQAVEGSPLSGVEFFGAGDAGLLLQFGGSRLEIMPGTHVEAARGQEHVSPGQLREALYHASGSPVVHVNLVRGRALTLEFQGGLTLAVTLQPDDSMGLESAAYYDAAWRYEAY